MSSLFKYFTTVVKQQITNIVDDSTNKAGFLFGNIRKATSNLFDFETDIIWSKALMIFTLHAVGLYNLVTFDYLKNPWTTLWILGTYVISHLGMSGGAHRLWSHKSYKAKLPLRIFLLMCFSMCGQNNILAWVKNHRMHHKYCDTNADPHTTTRGYFYSHIGWVMMKEHPEYTKKSKLLDLSDVLSDPIVAFNEKYFMPLQLFFCFILPSVIPVYFWNETWSRAIVSQVFIRYMFSLNAIWTINSVAHKWGTRPYNKSIKPANNDIINFFLVGEGFHNYHHVFPWDYRSSETISKINYTTFLIEISQKLGLAYDLKYPSMDMIKKTVLKKGDGTHSMMSKVSSSKSD